MTIILKISATEICLYDIIVIRITPYLGSGWYFEQSYDIISSKEDCEKCIYMACDVSQTSKYKLIMDSVKWHMKKQKDTFVH